MSDSLKQVIIIRKDLNMRKGKIAAQAAHASMAAILDTSNNQYIITNHKAIEWLNGLFTKIVVSVNSEFELLELHRIAKEQNILCSLVQDAGLTEFNNVSTYTAVAIGPDYVDVINRLTGNLPLL